MALTDGLELAINFNSDVLDKSGNGRDGTASGMTYNTTTPMVGSGSGAFDGINDHVSVDVASSPQSDILDLTTGTIAVWWRANAPTNEQKYLMTTSQGLASPNGDEYYIIFRGDSAHRIQGVCTNGGSVIMSAVANVSFNDTNPHLCIVRSNGTGNIEIYIDDISRALTSSPLTDKFLGHAVNADRMNIGALERDVFRYHGDKDVDALAIWNRALTTAEMTEYWNGGAGIELEVSGFQAAWAKNSNQIIGAMQ